MKPRIAFWLTVLVGTTVLIGTCIQDFNAHFDEKPDPVPHTLAMRLFWQYVGGWLLIAASAIIWLSSAQNRAKLIQHWWLPVLVLGIICVLLVFVAMLI